MTTTGKKFNDKFSGEKISIEKLLSLIERNGGSKGLDLSGKDLSDIDLSPEALHQIRQKRKLKKQPIWQSAQGGINLEGVILSDADLTRACLRHANLRGSNLEFVDFIDTDISNSFLWDANMRGAILDGANLSSANIFGTAFTDSTITKDNIGGSIIQESQSYNLPSDMEMTLERNRFWQASGIYRHLKTTFDGVGKYSDASWAYRKARRMEKNLAKHQIGKAWKSRQWRECINNTKKWLSDNFVELISDYGESPLRVLLSVNIVWLVFALIYALISGVVETDTGLTTIRLIDYLAFSLGTMTTIEPVGLSAMNVWYMRFLMPLETLFAIALTGLFGFVLGNRINRV